MFFKTEENILFDSHAHINSKDYDSDIQEVISRAENAGVLKVIDIAVDLDSSKKSVELSKRFQGKVFSIVGIDPDIILPISELHNPDLKVEAVFNELSTLIESNSEFIIGIGESGVDNYWLKQSDLSVSEQEALIRKQIELLDVHVELAKKFDLPLSIHSRGYEQELISYLKGKGVRGVFHSFTGTYETAKDILNNDFGLGVNGIITFKSAESLREIYRRVLGRKINEPIDLYSKNVYLETDSPFLSPDRGERNEPANIAKIFEFIVNNL